MKHHCLDCDASFHFDDNRTEWMGLFILFQKGISHYISMHLKKSTRTRLKSRKFYRGVNGVLILFLILIVLIHVAKYIYIYVS